jgi:hypothetical protein
VFPLYKSLSNLPRPFAPSPPSLAFLRADQGVTGPRVSCGACDHKAVVQFDAMGVPDNTPFPQLRLGARRAAGRSDHGDSGLAGEHDAEPAVFVGTGGPEGDDQLRSPNHTSRDNDGAR